MSHKEEGIEKEAKELIESFNNYISEGMPDDNDDFDFQEYALKKGVDDYQFDDSFNEAIRNMYYTADLSSGRPFELFQQHLNSLLTYYQYLKRFMNYYSKQAMEYYERQQAIAEKADEILSVINFWDYSEEIDITEEIYQIQYENIIMSLYTVFERFLKQYIQEFDANAAVLEHAQGDRTVLVYMKYLHDVKGIFVPRSLFREYNKLRLVRNHFVHSNDVIGDKLRSYLQNDPAGILENDVIILNEKFIDNAFETIGNLVKCIEEYEESITN